MDCIYLDHNATTPTRPEVVEAMAACYGRGYANPASQHQLGQRARRVLEDAREAIAELLGANLSTSPPDRLIFTSSGTEANNLAVLGIARAAGRRAAEQAGPGTVNQIVVSAMEHASVLEPAEHLMENGWRLDTVAAHTNGVIRLDRLAGLLGEHTRLVSVMLGNHETGVLQPVGEVVALCKPRAIPVHTDAVQVAGKLPVDFRRLQVAAMTVAAHKFQGPLGIGALLLQFDVPIDPLLFGGHQQGGLRPGTESVALAVGMKTALELWHKEHQQHDRTLAELRDRFENALKRNLPSVVINGEAGPRLPHTSSVAFPGLDGQMLLVALDLAGVACSVGSACSSGSTELSPTLRAMQLPHQIVASSLRFSVGATTTEAEIDEAIRRIVHVVRQLRGEA